MQILITCPYCDHRETAPENWAEAELRCACGTLFTVPPLEWCEWVVEEPGAKRGGGASGGCSSGGCGSKQAAAASDGAAARKRGGSCCSSGGGCASRRRKARARGEKSTPHRDRVGAAR